MSGRKILITGGSGKIGRNLIRHFLEIGDSIIATTLSKSSREELSREFYEAKDRIEVIDIDLTCETAVDRIIRELEKKNIQPNCLINNARNTNFLKVECNGLVSRENFMAEYLLDVIVPYEITMKLADTHASKLKRVVNVGSLYGVVASNPALYDNPVMESPINYGVAKAALIHLTKELAIRLSGRGVLVNCVAFGGLEGRATAEFMSRYERLCPIGRMLTEQDIFAPVDMLLTLEQSAITGHTMVVDGGWSVF